MSSWCGWLLPAPSATATSWHRDAVLHCGVPALKSQHAEALPDEACQHPDKPALSSHLGTLTGHLLPRHWAPDTYQLPAVMPLPSVTYRLPTALLGDVGCLHSWVNHRELGDAVAPRWQQAASPAPSLDESHPWDESSDCPFCAQETCVACWRLGMSQLGAARDSVQVLPTGASEPCARNKHSLGEPCQHGDGFVLDPGYLWPASITVGGNKRPHQQEEPSLTSSAPWRCCSLT